MPRRTPISHRAVTGRFAHRISASRIPTNPLASTHPQFGKGRIVSAKTTFEMPSIMKKTIKSSAIVISPCAGLSRNRHPISTARMTEIKLQPKVRHVACSDQTEALHDPAEDQQPAQEH